MVLSDIEIRKAISDSEFSIIYENEPDIRSASICLHLSENIILPSYEHHEVDVRRVETYPTCIKDFIDPSNGHLLLPGDFILGSTIESIAFSNSLAGHISNISGLARLGLNTIFSSYVSPGFGAGFARPITLEIHNSSKAPIRIFPGMRVCHLLLVRLSSATENGYDLSNPGKYLTNSPQGSEFYKDTGLFGTEEPCEK